MTKSKSAFTMIELIFVIVILGILTAVAVPKISATRTDAKIASISQSIILTISEISAFAVATGSTNPDLSIMSNSITVLENTGEAILSSGNAIVAVGTITDCVTISVISTIYDENLSVSFGDGGSDTLCINVQEKIGTQNYNMRLRGGLVSY